MQGVRWIIAAMMLALALSGCDGGDNPVGRELNEDLEPDIEKLDLNRRDIFPGEQLRITWRSSGAFLFVAKLYFSSDPVPSADDLLVIEEECSNDSGDHCTSDEDVDWFCRYRSDNFLSCEEDNDLISLLDLTTFFDQLPKDTNLILELCNDDECETRVRDITFH
ncbi:MAG: hypothetical protein HKN19_07510 [Halioglobus sp.]|nr:hypothetical protein [Halioglobus sp.]